MSDLTGGSEADLLALMARRLEHDISRRHHATFEYLRLTLHAPGGNMV